MEKEKTFRDRIRGECIWSRGVYEAQKPGIYELLREPCGHEVRFLTKTGSRSFIHRDSVETTPHRLTALDFHNPEMQEVIIGAAMLAGAEVWRGVTEVDQKNLDKKQHCSGGVQLRNQ